MKKWRLYSRAVLAAGSISMLLPVLGAFKKWG
jgi:hypothetical protein